MIDRHALNYGVLYSFEPNFMKHIVEEDKAVQLTDEDSVAYHLDMSNSKWYVILVFFIFFLLCGLIVSLSKL